MAKNTHSVMPYALAKALMDHSVQHFDAGGMVAPVAPSETIQGAGPASSGSGGGGGILGAIFGHNDYNAVAAPQQQTNYGGVINQSAGNALAGYGTSENIRNQQQDLANALLAQTRGEGPNPAQAQLAQSTGQNAAMQAALMASQRGSSANVGSLARQAAMQGGAIQQNAAGQAAVLRAQQQLAAQGALAQQQQAMQSGNLGQQQLNAGLFQAGAHEQNAQNANNVANYSMVQGINSGIAQNNASALAGGIGGLLSGGSALAGKIFGGGAKSAAGGIGGLGSTDLSSMGPLTMFAAKGGEVPSHLHQIASIYHPEALRGQSFKSGGAVGGHAAVAGNSPKNDTIPAMLSPKEIVLPRSVTMADDAPQKAADFVRHLQNKKAKDSKDIEDADWKPVKSKSKKSLKDRVDHLEKMFKGGAA